MNKNSRKGTYYDRLVYGLKQRPAVAYTLIVVAVVGGVTAVVKNLAELSGYFGPERAPAVDFRYWDLEGHSVSLFLNGRLPAELKEQSGPKYFIVRNPVFDYGSSLLKRHGQKQTFDAELDLDFHTAPEGADQTQLTAEIEGISLLGGTTWDYRYFTTEFDPDTAWEKWGVKIGLVGDEERETFSKSGELHGENVRFERWLNCAEFLELGKANDWAFMDLYEELTATACPQRFAYIAAAYSPCGEAWESAAVPPRLVLRVVGIQNLEERPINLSKIGLLADTSTALREAATGAGSTAAKEQDLGDYVLKPLETAYIALHFALLTEPDSYSGVDLGLETEPALLGDGELKSIVAAHDVVRIKGSDGGSYIGEPSGPTSASEWTVDRDIFIAALDRDESYSSHEWRVGPAEKVTYVSGSEFKVTARDKMVASSIITEGFVGGSCPRLLVQYKDGAGPRYEGKILEGREGPAFSGGDFAALSAWPASLVVEERDHETSHVSEVSIVCSSKASRDRTMVVGRFAPALVLEQGESREMMVPARPAGWRCDAIRARVVGYYVPNSKRAPSIATQRSPSEDFIAAAN